MCQDCWSDEGSPSIDTPEVREAAALIERAGGDLPPMLDDFNFSEEDIAGGDVPWILRQMGPSGCLVDETANDMLAVCELFLRLPTDAHRASALGLADGFWSPSR